MKIIIGKKTEAVSETESPVTRAEVTELINQSLSSLRVYVAESDITQAQESIRAIVEQATF